MKENKRAMLSDVTIELSVTVEDPCGSVRFVEKALNESGIYYDSISISEGTITARIVRAYRNDAERVNMGQHEEEAKQLWFNLYRLINGEKGTGENISVTLRRNDSIRTDYFGE